MRDYRLTRNNNNNAPAMHMTTQQSSSGSLDRGQGVNIPSRISNRRSSSPPNQNKVSEDKNPLILPILVGVNNTSVDGSTPIPINIDNNLRCVDFKLGHEIDGKAILLRMLVDSDAAMNSGNKHYHRQIMSQFPDIVAEYTECGPGTKYNLVQLKVVVTQSVAEVDFINETLSVIIRFKHLIL